MAKGKTSNGKKILELDPQFREILSCHDRRQSPFVQIFVAEAENVSQKSLGRILGVLEVTDHSEESSYIVNYLISVIKKEYFSRPKRGAIESFEAALHKANLALSKLAEHGDIKWLGKINALIASIEKNNLHLSQSGTASAFLLRGNSLTDISEGLASNDTTPHPLKTFENISSGRLEKSDKLIIATDNLFDLFSLEELKKNALRFDVDQFFQFLHTAMINELDLAGALIIDIQERVTLPVPKSSTDSESLNVFSQSTFLKSFPKNPAIKESIIAKETSLEEKISVGPYSYSEETSQQSLEFVDEKSGHIYLKEDEAFFEKKPWWSETWNWITEKLEEFISIIGKKVKREKIVVSEYPQIEKSAETPKRKKAFEAEKLLASFKNTVYAWLIAGGRKVSSIPWKKISEKILYTVKTTIATLIQFLIWVGKKLWPKITALGRKFSALNQHQKLIVVFILTLIFLIPILFVKWEDANDLKAEKARIASLPILPLKDDKNVIRLNDLTALSNYSGEKHFLINLNNRLYLATEKKLFEISSGKSWDLPSDFGSAISVFGMDDLNVIFFINSNFQVISFAPINQKFIPSSITFPDNAHLVATGSYLTYLYAVDAKNNQIYRYPRAEGGFGEKIDWLKDQVSLESITDMAISDNVYLASGENTLWKFFRGKKNADWQIESGATPWSPFKVFTKPDDQFIFILDRQNSRIGQFNPNGELINQFYSKDFASADSIISDEANHLVYVSTDKGIVSFSFAQ